MGRKVLVLATAVVAMMVLSGCGATQTTVSPHLPKDIATLFYPVIRDADRAGISVLLPTRLPDLPSAGWTWSLDDYKLNTRGYAFSLVATPRALPPSANEDWMPGAGSPLVMATVSGPPAPYPIVSQMLAQPTGTVQIAPGIEADSYNHGMMVRWTKSGWTYTAIGWWPGTGIGIAKQIVAALGSSPQPVPGSRGQLTASQTGNPMYTDVYWTYGRRWFAMTGKAGPSERVSELRSLVRVSPSSNQNW